MRTAHLNTLAILFFGAFATACSYTTDFFVVNNSSGPVEVTYKLKLALHLTKEDVPGKIPKTKLGEVHRSDIPRLNDDQYRFDAKNDTISVTLSPGEALWITSYVGYPGHADLGPEVSEHFKIEAIRIGGAEGELRLSGNDTRTSFSEVSSTLYMLAYPSIQGRKRDGSSEPAPSSKASIAEQPVLPYCELADNREKYDGQVVRVRATLWFNMHGYFFLDKGCDGDSKQTGITIPREGITWEEIESKIAKDLGVEEYTPWEFPEIVAVGRFRRVTPSRASDAVYDNTHLLFEIIEIANASKSRAN